MLRGNLCVLRGSVKVAIPSQTFARVCAPLKTLDTQGNPTPTELLVTIARWRAATLS